MPRRNDAERGAVAVEFAFVFVLMMGLFFTLVEGGIIFMHQASVSAAAREGARMLAITGEPGEPVDQAARDAYSFGALDQITPVGTCSTPPDRSVVVEVEVLATPTFSLGIFGTPQLKGVGAMRCGG